MRPLQLSIEGFMAFRDKAELDFTDKSVFVLMGPTGSGKSSILDAISFALYGETPRIGSKELKKLIYQDVENPRQVAQVSLAFRHQGQDYRIIRQISESGQRVELEARLNPQSPWQMHTTGKVSAFKLLMPKLLGLDFRGFSRVLMLPQGGFDSFLKQDGAKERRELLVSLAQLEVYEQIQAAADKRRRELETRLSEVKGALSEMGDVSAAQVAELEQQQNATQQDWQLALKQAQASQEALKQAETLWDGLQALQANQAQLHSLQERQGELDALQDKLARGQQLRELASELNYLLQGQSKLQRLTTELQTLAQTQAQWQQAAQRWEAEADSLAQQAEAAQRWQTRQVALQELKPQVQHWQRLQHGQTQASEQLAQRQAQLSAAQQALAQAQATAASQSQLLLQLEPEQQQLDFDPEHLLALAIQGRDLKELQETHQPRYDKLSTQLEAIRQRQREQASQSQLLQTRLELAQQALSQSQAELAQTEEAVLHCQTQAQAASLRQHLVAGEPCPVCLQHLQHLPTEALPADLQAAQQAHKAAQQAQQQAARQLQELEQEAAVLASESAHTQQQVLQFQAEQQQLAAELTTKQAKLKSELGLPATADLPELAVLRQQYEALKKVEKRAKMLEQQIQSAQHSLQNAGTEARLAEQQVAHQSQEAQRSQTQLQALQSELQILEKHLSEVLQVQSGFAQALSSQLQQVQHDLEARAGQLQALETRRQQLDKEEIQFQSSAQHLQREHAALQAEQTALTLRLQAACQPLGYTDLQAAQAALPSAEQLKAWQQELQQHQQQLQALWQEQERLQTQIAGRQLSQSELQALRQTQAEAAESSQQLGTEAAVLARQLEQARQQLTRSQTLLGEQEQVQQELGLYQRIYHDLGSRQLPDFLAKRILERVIAGGSEELQSLSQARYRFELDAQEELVILDAWNAHEPRSVKTLSGGESFLASLALALALNQYLAGGVQLDSLFIDEGFGTLDAEALELAAEVIEKLQLSGKCVGVITHMPELAERFSSRIQVHKSDAGARISLA